MTEYDETNRGTLFKNSPKKSENSPDFSGKLNVEGVEYRIASWIKTSGKGNKFHSISITKLEDQPQQTIQTEDDDAGF